MVSVRNPVHGGPLPSTRARYVGLGLLEHQEKRKLVMAPNYRGLLCSRPCPDQQVVIEDNRAN